MVKYVGDCDSGDFHGFFWDDESTNGKNCDFIIYNLYKLNSFPL